MILPELNLNHETRQKVPTDITRDDKKVPADIGPCVLLS